MKTPELACDVAIIGGGASGLAAALSAARAGASVLVIERDVEAGLPILATGNGRCNVSNARLDPARYLHPEAARAVMGPAPEAELEGFFASLGLMTAREGDRLYPYSKRAASVRDALLSACRRARVRIVCGARIASARPADDGWLLVLEVPAAPLKAPRRDSAHARLRAQRRALDAVPKVRRPLAAQSVIIAVGGRSAETSALFGLPPHDEHPVLCPVSCRLAAADAEASQTLMNALDGVRQEGALELERAGAPIWRERGEVLFRAYGLSGIVAFDLSRRALTGDRLSFDLFPDLSEAGLARLLEAREAQVGRLEQAGPTWFDGVIAPELARAVCACAPASTPKEAARACKRLPFAFEGLAEERSAQVRRGGIALNALELGTLRVRAGAAGGLFACGEALDQDADCGGFNLAWAWLSGLRAGRAAAKACER